MVKSSAIGNRARRRKYKVAGLDKPSFRELVCRHSSQVLNTAMRVLGNSAMAQDVHQEVFLAIWRRWDKYNGRVKWKQYLYKTTVRKAISFAGNNRSYRQRNSRHRPAPAEAGPEENLDALELRQRLSECLSGLPKQQADAFVLVRIEKLPTEEVAQILNCSQNTVRVHLHRAVKKLSSQLSDYLGE